MESGSRGSVTRSMIGRTRPGDKGYRTDARIPMEAGLVRFRVDARD